MCNNFKKTLKITSLGDCLRQARETMGLSQQNIATSLCLKLSIIKSIEEDCLDQLEISSIFLYGYIRSYARLVGVDSERAIAPILHELNPVFSVQDKKKFDFFHVLYGSYKDKTNLLIILCFVFCICMIVVLFIMLDFKHFFFKKPYSNTFFLKQPIDFITSSYSTNNLIFFSEKNILRRSSNIFFDNICYHISDIKYSPYFIFYFPEALDKLLYGIKYYSLYEYIVFNFSDDIHMRNNIHSINDKDDHTLAISFVSDCWLEVFDVFGKRLYVGTQYSGNILYLQGEIPYKLIIGAPQSVQIKYRGSVISLEQFVHPYKVARITIP